MWAEWTQLIQVLANQAVMVIQHLTVLLQVLDDIQELKVWLNWASTIAPWSSVTA